MKQPLLNSIHKSFTRRDTLGLQNISSSIQAWVCPVINVVTPHPFYWAFLVWNYYHFYSVEENKNASMTDFNKDFVKRNDFFFVLCNYIANNDLDGVIGKDKVADFYRDNSFAGPYLYDEGRYYQARFGGMQYYNYGCQVMGFVPLDVKKINLENDSLGSRLTRAFDSSIQNTSFYKNYVSQNKKPDGLSRDELIELSQYLKFNLDNKNEIKELIYNSLFKTSEKTGEKSFLLWIEFYLRLLIDNGLINKNVSFYGHEARRVLYGDKHPLILDKVNVQGKEKNVITRWELVIANQYYVACVEMIWKYLLSILDVPCTQNEWIDKAIRRSNNINVKEPLSSIKGNLSFEEIENNISNNMTPNTIYSALSVIMTIYNRFEKDRISDFECLPKVQNEYCVFGLIKMIKDGRFATVGDLLTYLMKDAIIDKHERVATNKQYYGRDGFLYEKVYDRYYSRGSDYTITVDIPSLRISNVLSVLRDLEKL